MIGEKRDTIPTASDRLLATYNSIPEGARAKCHTIVLHTCERIFTLVMPEVLQGKKIEFRDIEFPTSHHKRHISYVIEGSEIHINYM